MKIRQIIIGALIATTAQAYGKDVDLTILGMKNSPGGTCFISWQVVNNTEYTINNAYQHFLLYDGKNNLIEEKFVNIRNNRPGMKASDTTLVSNTPCSDIKRAEKTQSICFSLNGKSYDICPFEFNIPTNGIIKFK